MNVDLLMESDGLFRTEFPEGYSFTWRLLTLREYRKFRALRDGGVHPHFLHSMVFDRCYVGDTAFLNVNLPAGIPVALGECIMWLSGDCEMSTLAEDIEQARHYYPKDSVKEHMARIIYTAFPSYTEEDVLGWSYQELIRKFVIAEHILVSRIPDYAPLDTRKIHGPGGARKTPGVVDFNDLRKDNRDIQQAMGNRNHPLDMSPGDLAAMQQQNKGRLTPSMARKLDRRKQTRG